MENRFASLNEDQVKNLLTESYAKNTTKSTNTSWNIFLAYCQEKKVNISIKTCSKEELNDVLKDFYTSARKTDGNFYSKTSLSSIRWGIQRKIKEVRENIDIINDPEFGTSQRVFDAQCVELKKIGLAKVEHKPPITKNDIVKLYSSGTLSDEEPTSLMFKFFFEMMLYFCRRGQENLRMLKKTDFSIQVGDDGIEYVTKVTDELTKNRRVNDDQQEGGIMVATNKANCPVSTFKFYLSKLNPNNEFLFQCPTAETVVQCQ